MSAAWQSNLAGVAALHPSSSKAVGTTRPSPALVQNLVALDTPTFQGRRRARIGPPRGQRLADGGPQRRYTGYFLGVAVAHAAHHSHQGLGPTVIARRELSAGWVLVFHYARSEIFAPGETPRRSRCFGGGYRGYGSDRGSRVGGQEGMEVVVCQCLLCCRCQYWGTERLWPGGHCRTAGALLISAGPLWQRQGLYRRCLVF